MLKLPKAVEKLPGLYETEKVPNKDKMVYFMYAPKKAGHRWAWIPVEYDAEDDTYFGYVIGIEDEWGYFSHAEIAEVHEKVVPIGIVQFEKPLPFDVVKNAFSQLFSK